MNKNNSHLHIAQSMFVDNHRISLYSNLKKKHRYSRKGRSYDLIKQCICR